jgi:hypothetical protein
MTQSGGETTVDPASLDYAIDIEHPTVQKNHDIVYGNLQPNGSDNKMTFYRNRSPNGFAPELHQEPDRRPSLKLAVQRDAYLDATDGDYERCDRCELRDPKMPLGTPVWYSFEILADSDFPIVDARCVCAQIKAPYYDKDNGSPLFALRIDRGRYLATIEHLYEIKDTEIVDGAEVSRHVRPYPGPGATGVRALDHHVFGNTARDDKELQVRAVLATDSRGLPPHLEETFRWCTDLLGVRQERPLPDDIHAWQRFTIRVAPTSNKDEAGILQLLVFNRASEMNELVATAIGELGHAGYADPVGNDGPAPGEGLQYFKIGPYRDKIRIWGDRPAAIYVRNIRRGYWAEGAMLQAALRV